MLVWQAINKRYWIMFKTAQEAREARRADSRLKYARVREVLLLERFPNEVTLGALYERYSGELVKDA